MDTKKLNYLLQDIYLQNHKTFYKFYNFYSKIIIMIATNKHSNIEDKTIYTVSDFVQEIWVDLVADLTNHQYIFYKKEQFEIYLQHIVDNTIMRINNFK